MLTDVAETVLLTAAVLEAAHSTKESLHNTKNRPRATLYQMR